MVAFIILLQLIYFFYPFSSEAEIDPQQEQLAEELQHSIDSLKAQKQEVPKRAFFNPNFISDYKGYTLGMSVSEIDKLHQYRAQEKWINSSEDFQRVTGVSDSLLAEVSPYFKLPEFTSRISEKEKVPKKAFLAPDKKADLNAATAEELQKINGIGEKLSERIIRYRESLRGFRGGIQLNDVYGLSPEVVARALERFEVKENLHPVADFNAVTVPELAEIPLFDYELARKVVKFRESKGRISSFGELAEIKEFPVEKIDRIKLYLSID